MNHDFYARPVVCVRTSRSARYSSAIILIIMPMVGCWRPIAHTPGGSIDVGLICATTTPRITKTFNITNGTYKVINILGEEHSCSCTKVRYRSSQLPSGGSTMLELSVDIPRTNGPGSVTCALKTDDPAFPEWHYTLKYHSYIVASISQTNIDLGTYKLGGPALPFKDVELHVYAPEVGKTPARPVNIDSSQDIVVQLDETARVDSRIGGISCSSYRVRVGLRHGDLTPGSLGDLTPGSFARSVVIHLDDQSEASAKIVWSVVGPWIVSPSQLHFGLLRPGDASPRTMAVVIKASDGHAFDIVSAACDNAVITLNASECIPGDIHRIVLTLCPDINPSKPVVTGVVLVKTKDPGGTSQIRIPWSAFIQRGTAETDHAEDQNPGGKHIHKTSLIRRLGAPGITVHQAG
jgi:hypothetical protein